MSAPSPLKIAILASGSGTNAQAIFDKIAAGTLHAQVELVIANRPKAPVLERAQKAGVPTLMLDHTTYPDRETFDQALVDALKQTQTELIVLAGYMRLLTSRFLEAFPGRIINLHPAILPAFPGVHGGADAQAWGVKITGCTVHFVDELVDHGEVIVQAAVPAHPGEPLETLMQRIHALEHRIYPQAIQWFAEKRVQRHNRQVHILPSSKKQLLPNDHWLVWPPLEEGF